MAEISNLPAHGITASLYKPTCAKLVGSRSHGSRGPRPSGWNINPQDHSLNLSQLLYCALCFAYAAAGVPCVVCAVYAGCPSSLRYLRNLHYRRVEQQPLRAFDLTRLTTSPSASKLLVYSRPGAANYCHEQQVYRPQWSLEVAHAQAATDPHKGQRRTSARTSAGMYNYGRTTAGA